ncbi:MAG TPA: hypothetical protein DIC52_05245 [Candidatus Latescibacteria bacterium]|nr:hypothetical protein [Candidatus Latescibacterota bacterium]
MISASGWLAGGPIETDCSGVVPSIICLEKVLQDCPCGLLLVSHDERFLQSLVTIRWELSWTGTPGGDAQLAVREVTGGGYPHSANSITPKRAGCRRSL